jgi:hypothetical protein
MSATEIISEIAKLPVAEQQRVLDFLQNGGGHGTKAGAEARAVTDGDFEKAAEQVLRERAGLFRRLAQ